MSPHRRRFPGYRPNARLKAFTLVELVVSAAITTVIMLTITSSIILATRALPDASSPPKTVITASESAEQIAAELQYAISINSRSAKMIEFTVADRNGDNVPETIRYEWSGTAGQPLTRRYNSGTVLNILDAVQEFNLSYNLETVSSQVTPGNESSETLLMSYDSNQSLGDYTILDNQWYGQYFFPSLPVGTIKWKVTRVEFYAKVNGLTTGQCLVQLQLPTTGKLPSGLVFEQKTLYESTLLTTYTKQQFSFSNVSNLSPDKGLCLVFQWISDTYACNIRGRTSGAGTSDRYVVKSTSDGATWSALSSQSLLFWIYGTVTTAGTPQTQSRYYLKSAEIKLRTGSDQQLGVLTNARIINKPEVSQ